MFSLVLHMILRMCTKWVKSFWAFPDTTMLPARHEYHACCLRNKFLLLAVQPVGNTHGHGTCVG